MGIRERERGGGEREKERERRKRERGRGKRIRESFNLLKYSCLLTLTLKKITFIIQTN